MKEAARVACPRCMTPLAARAHRSTEHTLAWLGAGLALYIPANTLPIMYTQAVGGGHESTILAGILGFWRTGSWDIALLIFTASVLVPVVKFIALGVLLYTVRGRSRWAMRHRTQLHRLLEVIGYWSMLDVVVVALTCALMQFGSFAAAVPRPGIVFFCAVVVTTMMAARSFDPRLIWDTSDHGR